MGESNFIKQKFNGIITGQVYLQSEVSKEFFNYKSQYYKALSEFSEHLDDKSFPWLFARKAWKTATIRFLFCKKKAVKSYEDFYTGLIEYTTFVRNTPLKDRVFMPLVVFLICTIHMEWCNSILLHGMRLIGFISEVLSFGLNIFQKILMIQIGLSVLMVFPYLSISVR